MYRNRLLILLFALASPLLAQTGIPSFQYVTAAPTGACPVPPAITPPIQIVFPTGASYICTAGFWISFGGGGGGGGGVSSLNGLTGALAVAGDSTITVTPSGTTITLHVTGQAPTAWANVTGGINTGQNLIVGTNSTLGTSGNGQIFATSLPWTGLTGFPTTAQVPFQSLTTSGTGGPATLVAGTLNIPNYAGGGGGGGTIPATGGLLGTSGTANAAQAATPTQVQTAINGTTITPKIVNGVSKSTLYTGTTVAERVNACLSDAMNLANGNTTGKCDASAETGTQNPDASIVVGSPTLKAQLQVPCTGYWQFTMTGGTAVGVQQYGGSDVYSECPIAGITSNFYFGNTPTSNLYAIYEMSGAANQYIAASNFEVLNSSGHPTASGYSFIVNPTLTYVFSDASTISNVNVYDTSDTSGGPVLGENICCGMTWQNSAFNAGSAGTPLTLIASSSSIIQKVNFLNVNMVDPGPGLPILNCSDNRGSPDSYVDFTGGYTETNSTTTAGGLVLSTCQQVGFHNYGFYSNVASNGMIFMASGSTTTPTLDDVHFYSGTGTWTYPVTITGSGNSLVATDSVGNLAHYNPPTQPSFWGPVTSAATFNALGGQMNVNATNASLLEYDMNGTPRYAESVSTNQYLFGSAPNDINVIYIGGSNLNFGISNSPITVKLNQYGFLSTTQMISGAVATVASAATISPTAPLVQLTGTTQINTITVPTGFNAGCFDLLTESALVFGTSGNIQTGVTTSANAGYVACYWTALSKWTITGTITGGGGGSGTVTSVGLAMPSWLTVTGSPVTTSGTLTAAPATGQTSHEVIGTCGTATTFTPCALVAGDIPALPYLSSSIFTAPGDTVAANSSVVPTRIAGNTSATIGFYSETGNGTTAGLPSYVLGNGTGNVCLTTNCFLVTPDIGAATGQSLQLRGLATGIYGLGAAIYTAGATSIIGTGGSYSAPVSPTGVVSDSMSGGAVFTTGSGISAAGVIFTVTLPGTRTNVPTCTVNIKGGTAALGEWVTAANSAGTVTLSIGSNVALSNNTAYQANWGVCGGQ